MPDDHAPAREHVERGDRLRGQERVAVGRHQHVRLHAQPRRRRRHEGERHEGVERLVAAAPQPAVLGRGMVRDEGGVEARAFGRRAISAIASALTNSSPAATRSVGSWSVKRTGATIARSAKPPAPLARRSLAACPARFPISPSRLEPKLWTVLREGISRAQLARDVLAGVIVGVVALPLAIAFAIASGVRPEQGLATAIVAGFLISALGGSRVQIGGPTGAFVVIVYGVVQRHGYDGPRRRDADRGRCCCGDGPGAARHGDPVRALPRDGGLHLGHRADHRHRPAARLARPATSRRCRRASSEQLAAYAAHLGSLQPAALAIGLLAIVVDRALAARHAARAGPLVAIVLATALGARSRPAGRDDRRPLRRGARARCRAPTLPAFSWARLRALVPRRARDRAARRDREPALGGGGRRHGRARATARTWSWSRRASRTWRRRSSAASPPPARSRAPPPT